MSLLTRGNVRVEAVKCAPSTSFVVYDGNTEIDRFEEYPAAAEMAEAYAAETRQGIYRDKKDGRPRGRVKRHVVAFRLDDTTWNALVDLAKIEAKAPHGLARELVEAAVGRFQRLE